MFWIRRECGSRTVARRNPARIWAGPVRQTEWDRIKQVESKQDSSWILMVVNPKAPSCLFKMLEVRTDCPFGFAYLLANRSMSFAFSFSWDPQRLQVLLLHFSTFQRMQLGWKRRNSNVRDATFVPLKHAWRIPHQVQTTLANFSC